MSKPTMSDQQHQSAFEMYKKSVAAQKANKNKFKTNNLSNKKKRKLAKDDDLVTEISPHNVNGFPKSKKNKKSITLATVPESGNNQDSGPSNKTVPVNANDIPKTKKNGRKTRPNWTIAAVARSAASPPTQRSPSAQSGSGPPGGKSNGNHGITKSPAGHDNHADELEVGNVSSVEQGRALLAKLIAPMTVGDFFKDFWEQRPMVVKRLKPGYFGSLGLSCESLDQMLRKNHLRFTKNVDITSYIDGKRETHNPPGRATPAEVWDYFNEGCSVRWLNPQTYAHNLYTFCAALQEYLECFVGANVYLTPPSSQGFAPHYDDIEAFILQLEGRKHWKLYKSPLSKDVLPRNSSENYSPAELGEPFMEVTLEAGDLLYFPRGTIHQAVATGSHSLHVTLSAYQHNSWADLLEQMLPAALSEAIAADPALRGGLPVGHLSYMGSVHAPAGDTPQRAGFIRTAHSMLARVVAAVRVDHAVDRLAKRFMEDALPPHLSAAEASCSMFEDGDRLAADGKLVNSWAMNQDTLVRLTRAHCVRLVYEENIPRLYYTLDNTRTYHEEEPGFFELTPEMVPCVRLLVREYPAFIPVDMLPLEDLKQKVDLAGQLWLKGIVVTHLPIGDGTGVK